ncbi:MAG: hypothetical protein KDB27_33415, partial [Planctomycetales bacterium]|nr:hypothetical protein [Planctomycetales bacterium]
MISLIRLLRKRLSQGLHPVNCANIDVALLDSRILFSANPLAMTIETAEDAPAFDVDLEDIFTIDDNNPDTVFQVQSHSNEHIQSLTIEDGHLQIELKGDANGQAEISLLASIGAVSQELELTLDIEAVNDAPEFLGFTNVTSTQNFTTVDLFAAFEDVEDDDQSLTFSVASMSDAFSSASIDQETGILTLFHSSNASGVADVVVTATDTGGLTTGEAAPEGFQVYDSMILKPNADMPSPADLGLTKLQFWTSWYFFEHDGTSYDTSELDADGFAHKILKYASNRSKIVFDIENDYYTNTPEGRDRFAEVLDIANELRPNLDIGIYRILPERQWYNPVNWARAQEDSALGLQTWFSRDYDYFKDGYDRWLERNAQYREQTVSAEFGGQTVADMVDTIYPSLYTFFFDNVRSSSRH